MSTTNPTAPHPNHPTPTSCHEALQLALTMVRASPRIGSWLFPNDSADHPFANASTIPPALFEHSLTMVAETLFLPASAPLPNMDHPPPDSTVFLVLIPIDTYDNLTTGFTFQIGFPFADSVFAIRDVIRSKFAVVGRFAFDATAENLLCFVPDFTQGCSLLTFAGSSPFLRLLVTVPKNNYTPHDLPSVAVGATSFKVHSTISQRPNPPRNHSGCESDRESLVSTNRGPSSRLRERYVPPLGSPVHDAISPEVQVASSIYTSTDPVAPIDIQQLPYSFHSSVGGLDVTSLHRSLHNLMECISSNGIIEITRDLPSTKELSSPAVVGLFELHQRKGEDRESELLQRFAARTYYSTALNVSNDMRLYITTDEDEERE